MMRVLLALIAAFSLQVACQAGIVVKSVVVQDIFVGPNDEQQAITLQIRAGHDATTGFTTVGGFSFNLIPTEAPASFSAVTPSSHPDTFSWPGSFTLTSNGIGAPQTGINFTGNRIGLGVGSGTNINVDWGVDSAAGLIGEVTLTFDRPDVGDLPVEFSLTAAEDPLRPGNSGFLTDGPGGFQPVTTDYQSGTGVIQGLSAVPEPSSFALVGLGILGLARRRRR